MAAGDITFYNKFKMAQLDGDANGLLSTMPVDFDADTIKVAVMDSAFVPDGGDASAQEHWDDTVADQVGLATAYTGPITIASDDITLSSGVVTYDGSDIVISQDAGGFTDGRYIVFYKVGAGDSTSPLIAYGDLGANKGNVSGDLTLQWAAAGIFTLT